MPTRTIEIRPFSNGTQFMDWQSYNCCKCKKYELIDVEAGISTCPVAEAIADHACGEPLSEEMAMRMGYIKNNGVAQNSYNWRCKEFERGRPGPWKPPAKPPMDQQMRQAGMVVLPGFEGI